MIAKQTIDWMGRLYWHLDDVDGHEVLIVSTHEGEEVFSLGSRLFSAAERAKSWSAVKAMVEAWNHALAEGTLP